MRMSSPIFDRKPQRTDGNYTARQFDILNERIPLDEIRTNELTTLMRKAVARNDNFNYEVALSLYKTKKNPVSCLPKITVEEAERILQELTPWKIDWQRFKSHSK